MSVLAATPALAQQWTVLRLQTAGQTYSYCNGVAPGYQVGEANVPALNPSIRPVIWANGGWIDMGGPGQGGVINAAIGSMQVGDVNSHASLWFGTPQSRVDLHPAASGATYSHGVAASATEQGGYLEFLPSVRQQAALWHGSAASWVNLQPAGVYQSAVSAVIDGTEGGNVRVSEFGAFHAALWHGSSQSFLDLHPSGPATDSYITGVAADQQVGYIGLPGVGDHAGMWHGSAQTFVDFNPPGYTLSRMLATCGTAQVGWAVSSGSSSSAGIWFGTPGSFIALDPYLPAGYYNGIATSVFDDQGTFYIGGEAKNPAGTWEAVMWVGTVPAPGAAGPLLLALLAARRRRDHCG